MKGYPLCSVVLLSLLLMACESLTGPEASPETALKPSIPEDARVVEHILEYSASLAKIGRKEATVTFEVDDITPSTYSVRAYFDEAGTWAQMPYTLPADYCGEFIDLDYFFGPGTLTLKMTPVNVRPATQVLPPPTRIKVVIFSPADS